MNPRSLIFTLFIITLVGCSSSRKTTTPQKSPMKSPVATQEKKEATPSEKKVMTKEEEVAMLQAKIQQLDAKLAAMTDKMHAEKLKTREKNKTKPIPTHPADIAGKPVAATPTKKQLRSKSGFQNDEAVQRFRQATILFETQKHSDAILEFSSFLRDFADHNLASSAQFFIGECYFKQGEYRLAIEEYRRVLISYDRSSYVPDSLLRLAQSQEKLNLLDDAARNRQTLFSLFPQSPAARSMDLHIKSKRQSRVRDIKKGLKQKRTALLKPTTVETAPIRNEYF